MPEYIDIHSHISFSDFDADREFVVGRMKEKNVWAIDVGTDFESSKKALENSKANKEIFSSAGLHPADNKEEEFDRANYRKLFENPKVVAVGECGLDYFHIGGNSQTNQSLKIKNRKQKQKDIFKNQIELALEVDKPLMIHCREAYIDLLEILQSYSAINSSKLRGNIHFFSGRWEDAKNFLDLGFNISFTGVITFARNYDEVIKNSPLDMIMAETDSPFVTPEPYRGQRNEPVYVVEVIKKIAEIRHENFIDVKEQILKNSLKMFYLKSI